MAAILVFQNNETAAMLVYQTNSVGDQLFSYVKIFFCFIDLCDVSFNWCGKRKKEDFAPEG